MGEQATGVLIMVVIAIALAFVGAPVVMFLWNNSLIGAIGGIHPITFFQAWGIGTLCMFLFK